MAKTRPGNRSGSSSVGFAQGNEVWGTNIVMIASPIRKRQLAVGLERTILGALILLFICLAMTQTTLGDVSAAATRQTATFDWCGKFLA